MTDSILYWQTSITLTISLLMIHCVVITFFRFLDERESRIKDQGSDIRWQWQEPGIRVRQITAHLDSHGW